MDLDPELYRTILVRAKQQIRARMRSLRQAISAEALATRNQRLCERITARPWFESARAIALFWPMTAKKEVDLRALDGAARAQNKRVYYPFLADQGESLRTGLRLVEDPARLVLGANGFLEPPLDAPEAARGDVDLVFVPALAVTPLGDRLGYGKGFYDATLPDFCPPARSVVVAFDFQLLGELPAAEHDVRCDLVVTDERMFEATRADDG